MNNISLGDRIKTFYEDRYRFELMRRTYTIIRVDGKAFHTFTKKFKKPFDDVLMGFMDETAKYLCENIMGAKFAYVQSDEISILLTDFETRQTQAYFDYNIQKITSVASSMATARFNQLYFFKNMVALKHLIESSEIAQTQMETLVPAQFDARIFQVPNAVEAFNAILWRQQDASRNSVSMVARSLYSAKELHKKNSKEMQEMIFQKGINWDTYEPYYKRGRVIRKTQLENSLRSSWTVDRNIPIFSQEKTYLCNLIPSEEVYAESE